jgi:hypothetical protein
MFAKNLILKIFKFKMKIGTAAMDFKSMREHDKKQDE